MSDTFYGVAATLWSDTPHGAFVHAIEAQRQSVWPLLWSQCVEASHGTVVASSASREGQGEAPINDSVARADAAVIVAGFVLSVPFTKATEERTAGDTAGKPFADYEDAASSCVSAALPEPRRYLCVSLGSGSRCLGVREEQDGSVDAAALRLLELRDGHAEVMARRGFVAFLIDLAEAVARLPADTVSAAVPFLQPVNASKGGGWDLKRDVRVHLVCSRWMCGSLAAVMGGSGRSGHLLLRSACGCWASPSLQQEVEEAEKETRLQPSPAWLPVHDHVVAVHFSPLDDAAMYARCGRVKPGRGRPNLTMSCTDKVWRWSVLGLQGRRRAALFPHPIRLSSVHVLQGHSTFPHTISTDARNTGVAALAMELFEWRTRSWWPAATPVQLACVTPRFFVFAPPSSAGAVESSTEVKGDREGDSCYSRCRWLTVHCTRKESPTSHKRQRSCDGAEGDEAASVAASPLHLDWRADATSAQHHNSLVLNTKAGLPQGMTTRGFVQRALKSSSNSSSVYDDNALLLLPRDGGGERGRSAALDHSSAILHVTNLLWRQCPLSRAWMSRRVACALAAANEAAAPATATAAVPVSESPRAFHALKLAASHAMAPMRSSPPLCSVPCLRMGQLAHQQHTKNGVAEEKNDSVVAYLWTAMSGESVDCALADGSVVPFL